MANIVGSLAKDMFDFLKKDSYKVKGMTPSQITYLEDFRSLARRCSRFSEVVRVERREYDLKELSGTIDDILCAEAYTTETAEWINGLKPVYIVLKQLENAAGKRL